MHSLQAHSTRPQSRGGKADQREGGAFDAVVPARGGRGVNYFTWGEKTLHLKHYPRIELFSYFSLVSGAISGAIDILTLILGGG